MNFGHNSVDPVLHEMLEQLLVDLRLGPRTFCHPDAAELRTRILSAFMKAVRETLGERFSPESVELPVPREPVGAEPLRASVDSRALIGELLPAPGEAGHPDWEIEAAINRRLTGVELAGITVRVGVVLTDPQETEPPEGATKMMALFEFCHSGRPDEVIGDLVLSFYRHRDGSLWADHSGVDIPELEQFGRGFASQLLRYLEDWYRESGVTCFAEETWDIPPGR